MDAQKFAVGCAMTNRSSSTGHSAALVLLVFFVRFQKLVRELNVALNVGRILAGRLFLHFRAIGGGWNQGHAGVNFRGS